MIYVFDTSPIRSLQHFYPSVFKTIWDGLDSLVHQKNIISTREVWNELERQNVSADVLAWAKQNKQIFGSVVNRRPEIVLSVMSSLCHRQASNPL